MIFASVLRISVHTGELFLHQICRLLLFNFLFFRFTTLFACALPPSFLPRIWDTIMFFAGMNSRIPYPTSSTLYPLSSLRSSLDPSFLFRLGLAILKLCRSFIMDAARCRSADDARDFLIRPPANVFPSYPDAIISSALGLKVKEDELRKLRPKIEAQLKQRHPLRSAGPGR